MTAAKKSADAVAAIAAIDREIDATMAAIYMRVRCIPDHCQTYENAYHRCPDLKAGLDTLIHRRGMAQLERDALEHREWQRQQRRERAALRKIKTPQPSPLSYSTVTIGDLERLAGVEDRSAFWLPFARFTDGFQRGTAALRAMVEQRMKEAA